MTTDEFEKIVTDWIATAKHPKTGRLYTEMAYQPMLELLAYLRANGFKTFIVSGGGIEFMRALRSRCMDPARAGEYVVLRLRVGQPGVEETALGIESARHRGPPLH